MEHQLLLEKVGESKTDKLLQDCYKIYRESFDKIFPEYFNKSLVKAIAFVTVTEKNDNEIKGIGMSCVNDLLTQQFAQWFGGLIGSAASTSGLPVRSTTNLTLGLGNSHGGSQDSHWGNTSIAPAGLRGMALFVGNNVVVPQKDDFTQPSSIFQPITNVGSFSSILGQVIWSASGASPVDDTITSSHVIGQWSANTRVAQSYLLASDLISPGVDVTIGQSIFLEYKLVFS